MRADSADTEKPRHAVPCSEIWEACASDGLRSGVQASACARHHKPYFLLKFSDGCDVALLKVPRRRRRAAEKPSSRAAAPPGRRAAEPPCLLLLSLP